MTVEYQINLTEYLAKCINKAQPELLCNGQCLLMQKINDKEDTETGKNLTVYEYSSLYQHNESLRYTPQQPLENTDGNPFPPYLMEYSYNDNLALFRPPIG